MTQQEHVEKQYVVELQTEQHNKKSDEELQEIIAARNAFDAADNYRRDHQNECAADKEKSERVCVWETFFAGPDSLLYLLRR